MYTTKLYVYRRLFNHLLTVRGIVMSYDTFYKLGFYVDMTQYFDD